MSSNLVLVLVAFGSYLLGAIPFGVWVARSQGVDIFEAGSGNPGATNVWRAVGPRWGGIVFFLDVAKGLVPAIAARWASPDQAVWFFVGLVAVLGHSFSPFVGFRGGKGVATALGAALGAAPLVALSAFALFLVVLAASGYVSLGSIIAASSTVIFALVIPGQSRVLAVLFLLLAVLVVYRHRSNIRRLRDGTEPKFSLKKKRTKAVDDNEFGTA